MKKLLFLLMMIPVAALAQNSVWSEPIINQLGQPIPGITVAVCTSLPTTVVPCGGSSLATIFTSFTGGAQINPLFTDAFGRAPIFAVPGNYYLQIYGFAVTTQIVPISIGGGGIPCLIANTIQYNNSGVFGCEALLAYNAATHTLSAQNLNLTGLLNLGTPIAPTSQGNECAGVIYDSSDGTVTAVAVLQTIGPGGAVHDVACVVTSDTLFPTTVGSIVFPYGASFSTNSAGQNGGGGVLQSMNVTGGELFLTNNGGSATAGGRHNGIHLRACNNPGLNCGTDMQFDEDPTFAGYEEFLFTLVGGNNPLYFGNRLNSRHPGIYMGSFDASTAAVFGFSQLAGHNDHLVRLSHDTDIWDTITLSGGTATLTLEHTFIGTNPPLCFLTWQSGTLTGFAKCAATGGSGAWTGFTVTSSVGSDTAKFAYLIVGNDN